VIGFCSSNFGIQPPLMDYRFTRIAGHDARVQVGSHVPLPDIPRTRCLCSDLSINSFIFTSDEFFGVSALGPSNGKVTSGRILKMFHESCSSTRRRSRERQSNEFYGFAHARLNSDARSD
jgi:hypothetical protein